jgi:hypothetical protein
MRRPASGRCEVYELELPHMSARMKLSGAYTLSNLRNVSMLTAGRQEDILALRQLVVKLAHQVPRAENGEPAQDTSKNTRRRHRLQRWTEDVT